jgi:hypothetical protein
MEPKPRRAKVKLTRTVTEIWYGESLKPFIERYPE